MGTGGTRYGAGRPGYKVQSGQVLSIDVRDIARRGHIDRSAAFSWRWTRGDEPMGNIGITVQARTALTLTYCITQAGQAQNFAERVALTYTPCHFGQSRPWLLCPRCGHRVAKLYMRSARFACRCCQRVAYASQSQDALDRLWGRQHKMEAKLREYWQRPKGMRQRTYDRLIDGLSDCEQRREDALAAFMLRMGIDKTWL
jgi:hypothetical protein